MPLKIPSAQVTIGPVIEDGFLCFSMKRLYSELSELKEMHDFEARFAGFTPRNAAH